MSDKTVNLKQFPSDLYRKAKAAAALRDITVKELFIRAMRQLLNGNPNGKDK